jgi:hypothetical protein
MELMIQAGPTEILRIRPKKMTVVQFAVTVHGLGISLGRFSVCSEFFFG